jgi:hypothetical protein
MLRGRGSLRALTTLSQIVRARTRADAVDVAARLARSHRRANEEKRFGAPLFEATLAGALAALAFGYVAFDWVSELTCFAPRPIRGESLPARVRELLHGPAAAASRPEERVYVYGRPWARAELKCAQCRQGSLRAGEACFLGASTDGSHAADSLLCAQHYAQAHCAKCSLCAAPFDSAADQPAVLLQTGEAFCASHRHERPCYSCARPLGRADAAARPLCTACRAGAILSEEAAVELLRELKGWFATAGLDFGRWEPRRLRLVDEPPGAAGSADGHLEGLTLRSHGAGATRLVPAIHILHGLPRAHAAQVLVHELAHAWLWLQDFPAEMERHTEEGLCELFAYLWLLSEEARETDAGLDGERGLGAHSPRRRELLQRIRVMELNSDRTYGRGFRQALRAAESRGLLPTLEYARAHGRLPPALRASPMDGGGL